MLQKLILAAVIWAPLCVCAADSNGTITILEADAFIYRGAARWYAGEGVRLEPGDIVETAASGFMQLELPDLSVVQLGPSTRMMINGASGRQKPERWLFVMNGWCKVTGPKAGAAGVPGFELRTNSFSMPANSGVVTFLQMPTQVMLFVERGEIKLAEHPASGGAAGVPLKAGDHYARKAGAAGVVNPGSNESFLVGMPRAFRDSLPLRLERFRNEDVRLEQAPDFVYADVEPWLNAEPWLRRPLPNRWRAKARDPAFRAALIAGLSSHTEWDPILFPEKYVKKQAAARTARPPAREGALAPEPARPPVAAASAASAASTQ
jgi:hypothetical protein